MKCPACKSEVSPFNPAIVAASLEDVSWYNLSKGDTVSSAIGTLTVVEEYDGLDLMNQYGEMDQGSEFTAYFILKSDGRDAASRFFKKTGTGDSYGDVRWSGHVYEVFPQEKTVVVYDYTEDSL